MYIQGEDEEAVNEEDGTISERLLKIESFVTREINSYIICLGPRIIYLKFLNELQVRSYAIN